MTPINERLSKVVKLKLWVFKPIRRLTLHVMLHKNTFSSKIERFINPLSPSEIHEISISIQFRKIVFETQGHKTLIVSIYRLLPHCCLQSF